MTINNIMQSKEIITAPIVDAITPSGVVDSPSTCGALIFTDMKLIPLTQGKFAEVDDDDYDFLMQWKWHAVKFKNSYYAKRATWDKYIKKLSGMFMHRQIMNTPRNMEVDHRDHNGLNNQKNNLRNCSHLQNCWNSNAVGSSKYRGVSITEKTRPKWSILSTITINGKREYLGRFKTEEDAARAYDARAKELYGEFANLNFK